MNKHLIPVFLFLLTFFWASGQTGNQHAEYPIGLTPEQLARMIVGSEANISNVKFNNSSAPFNEITGQQIGIYYNDTVGFPEFGFDSCLMLCIANIACANYWNQAYPATCGWPPDSNTMTCPELEAILQNDIIDPAVLEFDFSINATGIGFEYIFASEEYGTLFVNDSNYYYINNDIFAFILTDSVTQISTNIALTPDSSLPVTILNTYPLNNPPSYFHPVEDGFCCFLYDGYLSPMTAFADIVPYRKYHIKICIAEGVNPEGFLYGGNTAVFLKCNTFTSEIDLQTALSFSHPSVPVAIGGCNAAFLDFNLLSRATRDDNLLIDLSYSGSAFNNVTFNPILPPRVVIPEGSTTARLNIVPATQNTTDTLELIVTYSYPATHNGTLILQDSDTIRILPSIQTTIFADVCQGETYAQYGFEVNTTTPHVYYQSHTDTTQYGCDSTTHLRLTAHSIDTTVINDFVCYGETYQQHNFNIYSLTDTMSVQELQSEYGCDSTAILHLTVAPIFYLDTFVAICPGEVFTGLGFNVSESGIYTHADTSIYGCDSTIVLTLDVAPITIYQVSGDNAVCSIDGGFIELSGSDYRRPYKIYCNDQLIDNQLGTGSSMTFGPYFQSGIYSVKCEVSNECAEFMLGTVHLYCIPTPPPRQIHSRE